MANFEKAYTITLGHEGGYIYDPDDAGGETYKGISRRYNKSWKGWSIIDTYKNKQDFPRCLYKDVKLQRLTEHFYKEHYWDVNRLDDLLTQEVANEMFDTGVNMGVLRAAKYLQEGLNYLNRNETLFEDLVVDGKIGPVSLGSLNILCNKEKDIEVLLKIMNVLQANHYLNYMKDSPTQEKYARGWFSRVNFSKE